MKSPGWLLGFVSSLVAGLAWAAESPANPPAAETAPRPANPPPVVSPEVRTDRTVTFRLRAPGAKEVAVSGEFGGGNHPLTRDTNGLWTATIGPLEPELYGYNFAVDGLRMADPANSSLKPMRSPTTSILEIPGDPPLLHEFTDVPHGAVRFHWYFSKPLERRRSVHVYTPPGYDQNTGESYPTLYLFHGNGDNDGTWSVLGRAHLILDQLIARKKARPMIVVMTDGHALAPGTFQVSTNKPNPNTEMFRQDLLESVMPLVEENYRTRRSADQRAIAGLSMGGGQSLTIGLNHPELFAWVGGFSSSGPQAHSITQLLSDPAAANAKYRLIWFACGKDDRLITQGRRLDELLTEKGIRHQFMETEGNHSWPVWRKYLAQLAPLLFAAP